MRNNVLEAVYNQVKLTMGDINAGPYEGITLRPGSCSREDYVSVNDNSDPFTFEWSHFFWVRSDSDKTALVDIARPMGFDNFVLSGGINTRFQDKWLNDIRRKNYRLYLQEAAENAAAILVHWRDTYGIVPRWHHPFDEPLSGTNLVWGGTTDEIVDLVKAIGARLRREGFSEIKLVVPSEESEEKSLDTAEAILSDRKAREYVGAISYHAYPYGSVYASVARILATSGVGHPDPARLQARKQIRALSRKYGLQTWMTEICCGGASTPFDDLRARAIHIHDEMVYTDASAYWGMNNITFRQDEEGSIVIFDSPSQTFRITPMGYAIGHYARWIRRGVVRIETVSRDPLVQVTGFRDDSQSRMVLVVINNATMPKTLEVNLQGLKLTGGLGGEQSTAAAFWQPLTAFAPTSQSSFTLTVPALSVTSIAGGISTFDLAY